MARFPAAQNLLLDSIAARAFPGAAYGVQLDGETLTIEAAGRFTYDPASPPVTPETIFDLASVSKVLATTSMAMLLHQRGRLDLDAPLAERLPEFLPEFMEDQAQANAKRLVTPRMLLAHSSGLPAYAPLFEHSKTAPALLDACLRMPLEASPRARTLYSDIGFILLGRLLETVAGEPIDRYCQREIFAPLGMNATRYNPPPWLHPVIPPTGIDRAAANRFIQGQVQDENCRVLGGVAGHAGVFSNVADTLRFAACILHQGAPLFDLETFSLFTTPQPVSSGPVRALGWDMPSPPSSTGSFFRSNSIGHLGYTGTSLWIDLEKQLAVALLTNRTFPGNGPEGPSKQIQQVRPRFHDAVLRELRLDSDSHGFS